MKSIKMSALIAAVAAAALSTAAGAATEAQTPRVDAVQDMRNFCKANKEADVNGQQNKVVTDYRCYQLGVDRNAK